MYGKNGREEVKSDRFTLDQNAFEVMVYESNILFQKIRDVFYNIEIEFGSEKLEGIALFVFGSPNRLELVKGGDIDAFLISPPGSEEIRIRIIEELTKLLYDKIDIPDWNSLEQVSIASLSNSPEGDYADASFIAGDAAVLKEYQDRGIRARFFHRTNLLLKIIFHFHFWDLKYERSNEMGINLKYSHGGTRDILFIDWVHDLLSEGNSRNNLNSSEPQIVGAIRYFKDLGIISYEEASKILDAINTVNVIKYLSLELNLGTPQQGEGYLNPELAARLLSSPELESQFSDIYELATAYNNARSIIYSFKCKLYDYVYNLSWGDDAVYHKELIQSLWTDKGNGDYSYLESLVCCDLSKVWYIVASILCLEHTPSFVIDTIARSFVSQSGFEYLTRLMILHANTSLSTLNFLNSLPTLALAPETELKYRKLLFKRLNNEE